MFEPLDVSDRQIKNRQNKYQQRWLDQGLSPKRVDAFATPALQKAEQTPGKTPGGKSERGYRNVMMENILGNEKRQLEIEHQKVDEELRKYGDEPKKKKRRWDQTTPNVSFSRNFAYLIQIFCISKLIKARKLKSSFS